MTDDVLLRELQEGEELAWDPVRVHWPLRAVRGLRSLLRRAKSAAPSPGRRQRAHDRLHAQYLDTLKRAVEAEQRLVGFSNEINRLNKCCGDAEYELEVALGKVVAYQEIVAALELKIEEAEPAPEPAPDAFFVGYGWPTDDKLGEADDVVISMQMPESGIDLDQLSKTMEHELPSKKADPVWHTEAHKPPVTSAQDGFSPAKPMAPDEPTPPPVEEDYSFDQPLENPDLSDD